MMTPRVTLGFLAAVLVSLSVSASRAIAVDELAWPPIGREQRPWAYQLWLGSAVDKENMARELRRYRDAGMGGVQVFPIYGAKGAEPRYLEFLSPRWLEMLTFTIHEADRLDLGVDMCTCTGWNFGGPNVPREHGGQKAVVARRPLPLADKLDPKGETRWEALIARSPDGRRVEVTAKVSPDGRLDWQPEGPGWTLYAMGWRPTKWAVKRPAPGGAGLMINPFYADAMRHYLERFTQAFAAEGVARPRAMQHDSYEYYDCQGSPDLLKEFAARRGYRLQDQLESFAGSGAEDAVARVKSDYRETVSDLMVEKVFPIWTAWCHERQMLTRYQAHGSPANWLDLYALADIPETEMFGHGGPNALVSRFDTDVGRTRTDDIAGIPGSREPLVSKFASSAAHLAGHRLTSAETGTWMSEHFCETLEELKCLVDRMFVSGINHVVWSSTAYSPDDAAWPGWLFYGSIEMNPRMTLWHSVPALNAYVARCQSILQSGQPDNDVLLYWPLHDYWHQAQGMVFEMTVHKQQWLLGQAVGTTARLLWNHGYGFDYVSDRLLGKVRVQSGGLETGGSRYRVVVVPPTDHIPLATLEKLLELADGGATVIFQDRLPRDVPGLGDLENRRLRLKALLGQLKLASSPDKAVKTAATGRGRVLVGDLEAALTLARVRPESFANADVLFIRHRHDEGCHYFIANQSLKPIDGWVALAVPARSVVVLDPLTGATGVAASRPAADGRVEVNLHIEPGHSLLLRTLENRQAQGTTFHFSKPGEKFLELAGPWKVEFLSGGPTLPKPYETRKLESWTNNGDPETERFAGTAVYRTTFDLPEADKQKAFCLDLGRVSNSARVRLNGRELGTLLMNPYRVAIDNLKPAGNLLEVEVTNLTANRIRDMDRRKMPWRIFHDTNFVNIRYRPFDASHWPVFESGLLGPVSLWTEQR
jgi:hypothetical protein